VRSGVDRRTSLSAPAWHASRPYGGACHTCALPRRRCLRGALTREGKDRGASRNERSRGRRDEMRNTQEAVDKRKAPGKHGREQRRRSRGQPPLTPTAPTRTHEPSGAPRQRRRRFRERRRRRGLCPLIPTAPLRRRAKEPRAALRDCSGSAEKTQAQPNKQVALGEGPTEQTNRATTGVPRRHTRETASSSTKERQETASQVNR
jgi:hypothetical protein